MIKKLIKRAAVGVFIALLCGASLLWWWLVPSAALIRQKASDTTAYEKKFAGMQRDLKSGIPLDSITAYARARHMANLSSIPSELVLRLQTITSTEWYCSRWGGYAELHVSDGKLVTIERSKRGEDCL